MAIEYRIEQGSYSNKAAVEAALNQLGAQNWDLFRLDVVEEERGGVHEAFPDDPAATPGDKWHLRAVFKRVT